MMCEITEYCFTIETQYERTQYERTINKTLQTRKRDEI